MKETIYLPCDTIRDCCDKLFEVYGYSVSIETIEEDFFYLTNGDVWHYDDNNEFVLWYKEGEEEQ